MDITEKINKLKEFYVSKPEISMAFLFGSYAKNKQISESDVDVAVYFKPESGELEWEEEKEYPTEKEIWRETENILGIDTDLVVLNRVSCALADEVLRTGIPVIIKDRDLYLRFWFLIGGTAEDFRQIVFDWWTISERSRSLTDEDRRRLIKATDFLQRELEEIVKFKNVTQSQYLQNSDLRRNLERWVENIANASIDISKTILGSEREKLPEKYADIMRALYRFEDIGEESAVKLAEFAKLRNLLAHEYLDLRFTRIRGFLDKAEELYGKLLNFSKKVINKTDQPVSS